MKFLHLNDNTQYVSKGQPGHDPIFKLRPFLQSLLANFQQAVILDRDLSVDEQMISFKVTALKWMDKRPVVMLSSIHDSSMVAKRRRSRLAPGGTDEVMKPKMIEEYNNKMGGVDKSDQLLSYYGFPHRTVKWWKRAFYHLVDLAIVQAYTLYRQSSQAGRHLSHQQFRIQLAKELLHSAGEVAMSQVSPHSHPPIAWLTERHFPDRTELNANGKFLQPDCVVCSRKRGSPRKTTSYICKQCDLPMCITPCFELYHTKVDPLRYL